MKALAGGGPGSVFLGRLALLLALTAGAPLGVPTVRPGAVAAQEGGATQVSEPTWAVPGMPDTVRSLVEAAMAADDEDRVKELLVQAEGRARIALEEAPDDVDRSFALGVVLGLRADREGGRTKVRAAAELHDLLEAILAVEPEHARARHMLGRLHAGVRRMNRVVRWIATSLLGGGALDGATWEEAERHLEFAERRAPEVLDHHLQLANLYRDTGRPEEALREVEHVLALPARSPMEEVVRREALDLQRELRRNGGGR